MAQRIQYKELKGWLIRHARCGVGDNESNTKNWKHIVQHYYTDTGQHENPIQRIESSLIEARPSSGAGGQNPIQRIERNFILSYHAKNKSILNPIQRIESLQDYYWYHSNMLRIQYKELKVLFRSGFGNGLTISENPIQRIERHKPLDQYKVKPPHVRIQYKELKVRASSISLSMSMIKLNPIQRIERYLNYRHSVPQGLR